LRSQCLKQTTPYRSVLVHEHEGLVNEAKAFQGTDIFRTIYRTRVAVEHRIARLMRFGARKARYFGSSKVLFQLAMTAALANLTLVASHAQNTLFVFFVLTLSSSAHEHRHCHELPHTTFLNRSSDDQRESGDQAETNNRPTAFGITI
jgi:hypothetical protein